MKNKFIVAILSCKPYADRRKAINETYGKALKKQGIPYYFLIGDPALQKGTFKRVAEENILYFSCPDDYENLSLKMKHFFTAIPHLKHDYNYILKCDDDTFINVPNLLEFNTKNRLYVGNELKGFKRGDGVASGGAGYLLHKNCVPVLAKFLPDTGSRMEDVYVASVLKKFDIALLHSTHFDPNHAKKNQIVPNSTNKNVTTHYVTPKQMYEFMKEK